MAVPTHRSYTGDLIAGAVLILSGLAALIVRLDVFQVSEIPALVQHWWPAILIGLGLVLGVAEQPQYWRRPAGKSREVSLGK